MATAFLSRRNSQVRVLPMTIRFQTPPLTEIGARGYAIEPGCFGPELAHWLMDKLERQGLDVDPELTETAHTWEFSFVCDGARYRVEIEYRPDRVDCAGAWIATLERVRRPFRFGLGWSSRDSDLGAVDVLHAVLVTSPVIADVEWKLGRRAI